MGGYTGAAGHRDYVGAAFFGEGIDGTASQRTTYVKGLVVSEFVRLGGVVGAPEEA